MRGRLLASGIGAACVALAMTAAGNSQSEPPPAAQPAKVSWRSPAGDAERGATLAATCGTCHSATAPATDPPAPKLQRQRQSYLFFALLAYRDGTRQSPIMAPFVAGMSDQDLRDLAAYVADAPLDQPPDANVQHPFYQQAVRDCTWCHGETGIGEFEGMPVLAGQDARYLAAALAEYRHGVREDPTMQGVAADVDAASAAGLADYYASHAWLERGE